MSNVVSVINAQRDKFLSALSDPHIDFVAESQFAQQALANSQSLAKVAQANIDSLKSAIINVAAIGISLNPAAKLAYLLPRNGKVCLDISYRGLLHLAQSSGAILWGQSRTVHKDDFFELRGISEEPIHRFDPFAKSRMTETPVGVYVVVKTQEGDFLTHTMGIDEVFAIRDRSSAWIAYKTKKLSCPWVTDEQEMIKKTCVKQASKYWPHRKRLALAIDNLNESGEGIQFDNERGTGAAKMRDVTPISSDLLDRIYARLAAIGRSEQELLNIARIVAGRPELDSLEDLTEEEGGRVIAMLHLKKPEAR